MQKRVFSSDLEESKDETERRVPDHRSDVLTGFLPQVLLAILGTQKIQVSKAEQREQEGE